MEFSSSASLHDSNCPTSSGAPDFSVYRSESGGYREPETGTAPSHPHAPNTSQQSHPAPFGTIAWPGNIQHKAPPHEYNPYQLIATEAGYHGQALSHRWWKGGI